MYSFQIYVVDIRLLPFKSEAIFISTYIQTAAEDEKSRYYSSAAYFPDSIEEFLPHPRLFLVWNYSKNRNFSFNKIKSSLYIN